MSDVSGPDLNQPLRNDLAQRIATRRTEFFWLGIAMVVIGVLAIFFPFIATLTVEVMIGWLLLLAGVVTIGSSFSIEGTGAFFGSLLLGLLYVGLGIYFLTHPGVGIVVLTIVLAALLMVEGAVQLAFSFEMRKQGGWFWMLLSGLVSIAAGILIAAGLPGTSLFALGLLVGVSFLSTGLSFIFISQAIPKPVEQTRATSARTTGQGSRRT